MGQILKFVTVFLLAFIALQFVPDIADPFAPSPKPVDPVDPDPVKPDDELNFDKYEVEVYKAIMKVKSRGRKDECHKLSAGVKKIIGKIDSGEINTNQGVVDALVVEFKKLPMAWYGQIRTIANDVLQPLTNKGHLSTTKRWRALLVVADRGIVKAEAESAGVAEVEE